MRISLVVAVAENGVIGRDGGLPWHVSSDLKTFRRLTMGKPLIMGRRTFQSLQKPLDGRDNIVVTRDAAFAPPVGVLVAPGLDAALALARQCAAARGVNEIMVIGGSDIFKEALPLADRIYKTEIHGSPEGDTYFPELNSRDWKEVSREALAKGPRDEFSSTFLALERARGPA